MHARQTARPAVISGLPTRQRGMALVFVLIMISIVFVIAAVSSRIVTLGERAARNDRDRQVAFQAAEAALSDAEMDIMGPNTGPKSRVAMFGTLPAGADCSADPSTRGYCGPLAEGAYKTIFANDFTPATGDPCVSRSSTSRQWVEFGEFTGRAGGSGDEATCGRAVEFAISDTGALPVKRPRYIIEKSLLSFRNRAETVGKPFDAFVVTAIGYGLQPGTQVVLQAVISKPVPTN